jgi:hypothetical protein
MPLFLFGFHSHCTVRELPGHRGKPFPFLALFLPVQTFTLLSNYDPISQLIDTVAIAAKTGGTPAAFCRTFHAC